MMRKSFVILIILLLAFMPLVTGAQQGPPPIPATPVAEAAPVGVLAEFEIDELPTPHAEVWFLRTGLEPDGQVDMGAQAGPTVIYVEQGTFTLTTDGDVQRFEGGNGACCTVATPATSADLSISEGEAVLVPADASLAFSNTGDEPAVMLLALMFSGMDEGAGGGPGIEPIGLSQQGVSIGLAEFPYQAPGTLTIERVVVEPGTPLETQTFWGIELGAVENGRGTVALTQTFPMTWVWPGILDPASMTGMPQRNPIDMSGTMDIGTLDGYTFFNSTTTWEAAGDEPLIILRVVISPDGPEGMP